MIMRKLVSFVMFCLLFISVNAQNFKPYIIAFESNVGVAEIKKEVNSNLQASGIEILGAYQPASDPNRWVIIVTSDELISAVKRIGGLSGFAVSQRVAITREGNKTIVSYTNPEYWGHAYFRNDFVSVSNDYQSFETRLIQAMRSTGNYLGTGFGSEGGMTAKELQKYHYMLGMPYFDDTVEIGKFSSYAQAISTIDNNLNSRIPDIYKVYKKEIPEKMICLYGIGLKGPKGEEKFMPVIDIGTPKHTAFLPYEILVVGNEVLMLHGRYRIAISFPDLTMGTFTKIMSTPGNIEEILTQCVQ
jgi:hypothetical protein